MGGRSAFVGDKLGAANVLDAALVGAFHTIALGGFLDALAFIKRSGSDPAIVRPTLDRWMELLGHVIQEALDDVESGNFSSDQVSLGIYLVAVQYWRNSMAEAGGLELNRSAQHRDR